MPEFKDFVKKLLEEEATASFAVAIWRTPDGFNCYVKGSEFEILGSADYLQEIMKGIISQRLNQQNRSSKIVVPAHMMSPSGRG